MGLFNFIYTETLFHSITDALTHKHFKFHPCNENLEASLFKYKMNTCHWKIKTKNRFSALGSPSSLNFFPHVNTRLIFFLFAIQRVIDATWQIQTFQENTTCHTSKNLDFQTVNLLIVTDWRLDQKKRWSGNSMIIFG